VAEGARRNLPSARKETFAHAGVCPHQPSSRRSLSAVASDGVHPSEYATKQAVVRSILRSGSTVPSARTCREADDTGHAPRANKSGPLHWLPLLPGSLRRLRVHAYVDREFRRYFECRILGIARSGTVSGGTATTHRRKFEVDGILTLPTGRSAMVRTVWIIRAGDDFPRLVTVFPR
jgi:hypothetical protein